MIHVGLCSCNSGLGGLLGLIGLYPLYMAIMEQDQGQVSLISWNKRAYELKETFE